ncbi:MAG: ImmA/IrrE family metallo-endopeptidase [Polyangiaceae bacterium]
MTNPRFEPTWASPPGETIRRWLRSTGESQHTLAGRLNLDLMATAALLAGARPIDQTIAASLAGCVGGSVDFWLQRELDFREGVERQQANAYAELACADLVKWGLIPRTANRRDQVLASLRFLGAETLHDWRQQRMDLVRAARLKTSETFSTSQDALAVWLRAGDVLGEQRPCGKYNPDAVNKALPELRKLSTLHNPSKMVERLSASCTSLGIVLILLPSPKNCRATAAIRMNSKGNPILQMSLRHKTNDHFWFAFFHELGHLLLHSPDFAYVDEECEQSDMATEEREANAFAASTLVPPHSQPTLSSLPIESKAVIRFAQKIGVAPGIVVGQLEHLGRVRHGRLNALKRTVSWQDLSLGTP